MLRVLLIKNSSRVQEPRVCRLWQGSCWSGHGLCRRRAASASPRPGCTCTSLSSMSSRPSSPVSAEVSTGGERDRGERCRGSHLDGVPSRRPSFRASPRSPAQCYAGSPRRGWLGVPATWPGGVNDANGVFGRDGTFHIMHQCDGGPYGMPCGGGVSSCALAGAGRC